MKLETIDAETARLFHDRLYYTVRCNLIDRKQRDNWINDQRAREITAALVAKLDGLFIFQGAPAPRHSANHYMSERSDDLEDRVQRSIGSRPHQLPVMNAKPAPSGE